MKAIIQDRYGSPDVLSLSEVDTPTPAAGEVLVKVAAASLNARDWHVMRGDPKIARLMDRSTFGREGPKIRIPGTDFAGRVEAVGSDVRRLRVGDEVYGESLRGLRRVRQRSREGGGSQARQSLLRGVGGDAPGRQHRAHGFAGLTPGQRILINGASGGVGTFAVQIAKAMGAHVTGVCSTRNVDLVRSLGADEVIDYTSADFAQAAPQYDVLFDLVGNRSLRDMRRVLTRKGTLILSGGGVWHGGSVFGPVGLMMRGTAAGRFVSQRVQILSVKASAENLVELADLAESGQVKPVIDRTYPLAEAADALRYLEGEHARAKVVLTV